MFSIYSVKEGKLHRELIIYEVISALWDEKYNTACNFTIELNFLINYVDKIKVDYFVIWKEAKTLMKIDTVEIENKRITISGSGASKLLLYRGVEGILTGNKNVEQTLYTLVNNSNFEYLTADEITGYTDDTKEETGNVDLFTVCEELTQAVDMGFEVYKDGNNVKFRVYKPIENPNFKYGDYIGNLQDEQLTTSVANHYDAVKVIANGFILQGGNTGVNRKELTLDKTSENQQDDESYEQYQTRLLNLGLLELGKYKLIEQINFNLNVQNLTNTANAGLGDIVTVVSKNFNYKAKIRIIGIQTKTQNNKIERTAEVGTPIIWR